MIDFTVFSQNGHEAVTKVSDHGCLMKVFVLGLSLFIAGLLPLAAVSDFEESDRVEAPYFKVNTGGVRAETFPLHSTEVKARISGVIADVTVKQVYQNRGEVPIEAVYLFPGSTRSAIHGLEMKIGSRVIVAKVQEKQSARKQYEAAKAARKTASLLVQHRPNVFQMEVANIQPGEVIEVILKYTEHLFPEERVYQFVYPAVVAPRFSSDKSGGDDEDWVSNPYLTKNQVAGTRFNVDVSLAAGMPIHGIRCNTHDTDQKFVSKEEARVRIKGDDKTTGDRDFVLRYRLSDKQIDAGTLFHKGNEANENFFSVTIQPPLREAPEEVLNREYLFIVDVSGSMSGYPLNTAKSLVKDLVGDLRADDRFNIVAFASGQHLYSPHSVKGSQKELKRAVDWMESRTGSGGTEMLGAFQKALSLPEADAETSRIIIVITDGLVSFDRQAFEMVRENLGKANLFAFGIGSSTNRYLVEGLAVAGHGESFFVTDSDRAALMAQRFRKYVESPVLTDIDLKLNGVDIYDTIPETIPDVFADRPITVYGKWKGELKGEVTLSGVTSKGRINLTKPIQQSEARNEPALSYLWARQKIRDLDDFEGKTPSPEAKEEIINLGLKYNLMTRFTSFLAIDEVVRNNNATTTPNYTVTQNTPMPQGISGGSTPGPGIIPLLLAGLASLFGKKFMRKARA
ncbi:MAG: VIT domain-containing protein [Verrucomicrobiales bacterium]|nr:VIT domain-containing protein [Verrucomicrobiales bacterium]